MSTKYLSWKFGGLLLGVTFFVALVVKAPIGVSTQFVIANGIVWNKLDSHLVQKSATKGQYKSTNIYLNKSEGKYAKDVANPVNYGFLFVVGIFLGGLISRLLCGPKPSKEQKCMTDAWRNNISCAKGHHITMFIAGFISLYGARLAGGCTSGHMMSGMMQTSVSGYLFAASAFAVAVPVAILLYKK